MATPKPPPPPLTDAEIKEAIRLQAATIRAVTEVLRKKGYLDEADLREIKQLRDALAAEIRRQEGGPGIHRAN